MAVPSTLHSKSTWQPREVHCPIGTVMGADCPGIPPESVLTLLHDEERQIASQRNGDAKRQWVAGRYCLGTALRAHGLSLPVLSGPRGKPLIDAGVAISISHKRAMSVAVATTVFAGVGIDLEHIDGGETALARKILTKKERARPVVLSARDVTLHFALKEALYKAAPDSDQIDMEFTDITAEVPGELRSERTWINIPVRVHGSSFDYRAYILTRGQWVLAVATRS